MVIHRNCFGAAAITLLEPEDIAFWYGGKGGLFIADAVGQPVSRAKDVVGLRWSGGHESRYVYYELSRSPGK